MSKFIDMNSFEIGLAQWSAWAPGIDSAELWQRWADVGVELADEQKPDLSSFPAMLRRRLGAMGKMALHSLLALDDDSAGFADDTPTVFCSQYGEVARSVKLLSAMAKKQPLSPTEFSLSVHNAVAGVYSIGCQQKQNITAISAGPAGFCAALLEARGLLIEHEKVLCVVYDAPLVAPYPSGMNQCPYPYALALLLTSDAQADQRFTITMGASVAEGGVDEPVALSFLRLILAQQQSSVVLPAPGGSWQCQQARA